MFCHNIKIVPNNYSSMLVTWVISMHQRAPKCLKYWITHTIYSFDSNLKQSVLSRIECLQNLTIPAISELDIQYKYSILEQFFH